MTSPLFPSIPSAPMSVSTFVMRNLLTAIVSGRLKTGDALPSESDLAQQLGVGISSVREALSALQGMGVISVRHGSGRVVNGLTFAAISDARVADAVVSGDLLLQVTTVRELLEIFAIKQAATSADEPAMSEIEQALVAMEHAVGRGELGVEEDGEFHLAIARSTNNLALVLLQESVNTLMNILRSRSHQQAGRPERAAHEHRAIWGALQRRDPDEAAQLLREHLQGGVEDASTLFGPISS